MINQHLLSFIQSRLYFILGNSLYRVKGERLVESSKVHFSQTFFPIIVFGREHYREVHKKYPVTNEKDLLQILSNDSINAHILSPAVYSETNAVVQTLELDDFALDLSKMKWCFWLPETWLIDTKPSRLLQVSRAGQKILGATLSGSTYTTVANGAFSNPDYFLMSIGLSGDTEIEAVDESQYAKRIIAGLKQLANKEWRELLKAQNYVQKINRLFKWPSIALGLFLGYGIFCLADLALLSFRHNSLDTKISQQQVSSVIQKQKALENKSVALSVLSDIGSNKQLISNIWQSVLTLMQERNDVLRVSLEGEQLQIRIESRNASDALALVQSLSYVASADFSTPVRRSVRNQRVTIAITFKNEEALNG